MRKKYFLSTYLLLFSTLFLVAQPPQKMSFQSVIRDGNNNLVVNRTIGIKISIIKTFPNGIAVYEETHQGTTNGNGLLTLEIGTGTPTPGSSFSSIEWENGDYFLKSEIDLQGGNQYTLIGTQQLITVPYSFHSGTSNFADSSDYNHLINRPIGQNTGDILYWNPQDSSWHIVPIGSPGQVLIVGANGVPQWYTNVLHNNLPPSIITDSVFSITGYTMRVAATILDPGTTGIIASGVCWSETNPSPSIGNNNTTDGSGTGSFVSNVAGLKSNTRYYVRAYATNSVGTSYGNVLVITTPTHCGTITDYDGNVYNTVYIGRQCWFKENLRTTHYADGNSITKAYNISQTYYNAMAHTQNGNSVWYFCNHDSTTKADRGLLYTWYAVMKGAGSSDNNPSGILGVCPYGWHVPSSSEWCELENNLNPGIDITCSNANFRGTMAKVLAKPKYWSSYTNNSFTPGYWHTDSTGFNITDFSLIPTGYIYERESSWSSGWDSYCGNTSYHYHYIYARTGITTDAYFWTSSSGKSRQINYSETGIKLATGVTLTNAFSVRCIKDY
jgi:uncharacterized protein (TIGR02145 family)